MVEWRNSRSSAAAAPPIGAPAAVTDMVCAAAWIQVCGCMMHLTAQQSAAKQQWTRSMLAASCQWPSHTVV
jgi:hypothetical protein